MERAKRVRGCLGGGAAHGQSRANPVIKGRDRFVAHGLPGLQDKPRPGAQRVYAEEFRLRVRATRAQPPPAGQAVWDGPAVAKAVEGSVPAVLAGRTQSRPLPAAAALLGYPHENRELAAKAADSVGWYLKPPENALVIRVDANPRLPALKRATG